MLVRACWEGILALLAEIINLCLSQGTFPADFLTLFAPSTSLLLDARSSCSFLNSDDGCYCTCFHGHSYYLMESLRAVSMHLSRLSHTVPCPSPERRPDKHRVTTGVLTKGTRNISIAKMRIYTIFKTKDGNCLFAAGLAHSAFNWCSKNLEKGNTCSKQLHLGGNSLLPLGLLCGLVPGPGVSSLGLLSCNSSADSALDKTYPLWNIWWPVQGPR